MRAVILLLLLFCGGIFTLSSGQQNGAKKPDRRDAQMMREVRSVMDAQVAAWNRGDVEGFMQGYAQSADTIFISGDNVTRGWQTVLDRYRKNYDSREKMGTLSFSEIEIMPVGRDMAIVIGRWKLERSADEPKGRFTLIFRRTRAGWRITHDHTS